MTNLLVLVLALIAIAETAEGVCSSYSNCKGCAGDSACHWCAAQVKIKDVDTDFVLEPKFGQCLDTSQFCANDIFPQDVQDLLQQDWSVISTEMGALSTATADAAHCTTDDVETSVYDTADCATCQLKGGRTTWCNYAVYAYGSDKAKTKGFCTGVATDCVMNMLKFPERSAVFERSFMRYTNGIDPPCASSDPLRCSSLRNCQGCTSTDTAQCQWCEGSFSASDDTEKNALNLFGGFCRAEGSVCSPESTEFSGVKPFAEANPQGGADTPKTVMTAAKVVAGPNCLSSIVDEFTFGYGLQTCADCLDITGKWCSSALYDPEVEEPKVGGVCLKTESQCATWSEKAKLGTSSMKLSTEIVPTCDKTPSPPPTVPPQDTTTAPVETSTSGASRHVAFSLGVGVFFILASHL